MHFRVEFQTVLKALLGKIQTASPFVFFSTVLTIYNVTLVSKIVGSCDIGSLNETRDSNGKYIWGLSKRMLSCT